MVNTYFVVALVLTLVVEAIDITGILLNLRALDPEVPAEFADVYDAETYGARRNTRGRAPGSASCRRSSTWPCCWPSGSRAASAGSTGWCARIGTGPVWKGLVFLVILFAAQAVLDIPFSVYGTFVIEERFGFNRTTPGTFVLDSAQGHHDLGDHRGAARHRLPGPVRVRGRPAWLYAWVAAVAFSFLMQFLAPRLIMPLFNKFTPLEDGRAQRRHPRLRRARRTSR